MDHPLQPGNESDCEYTPTKGATYSLRGLSVYMPRSAHEKPDTGIFKTEFRFEHGAAASAVIHTCISANDRQSAHGWLFASSAPDLHCDRPVAELAITSTGDTSLRAGCPADYDVLRDRVGTSLCRIEPPSSRVNLWFAEHGHWLRGSIVPLALFVAAAPSIIIFAQKTPSERREAYEAAKNAVPRLIIAQAPSLMAVIAPRPARELGADPANRDFYLVDSAAASDRESRSAAITPAMIDTAIPSAADDDDHRASGKVGGSAADKPSAAHRGNGPGSRHAVPSASASARLAGSKMAATKRVLAERSTPQTAAAGATGAPRATVEEPRAMPRERLALNTSGAERLTLQQQEQQEQCTGGFFVREICKERLRWSHCHPDKWDRVPECRVQHITPTE